MLKTLWFHREFEHYGQKPHGFPRLLVSSLYGSAGDLTAAKRTAYNAWRKGKRNPVGSSLIQDRTKKPAGLDKKDFDANSMLQKLKKTLTRLRLRKEGNLHGHLWEHVFGLILLCAWFQRHPMRLEMQTHWKSNIGIHPRLWNSFRSASQSGSGWTIQHGGSLERNGIHLLQAVEAPSNDITTKCGGREPNCQLRN